jgi:hypothetical protein
MHPVSFPGAFPGELLGLGVATVGGTTETAYRLITGDVAGVDRQEVPLLVIHEFGVEDAYLTAGVLEADQNLLG